MITTAVSTHGPEIAYLRNGINGMIVANGSSVSDYAKEVVRLLTDTVCHKEMKEHAQADGSRYSVEAMSERFSAGVMAALEAPVRFNFLSSR